jgi:hypothetical protein
MYVVRVRRRRGGGLVRPMAQMRHWLDTNRIAPRIFQLNKAAFRLEFDSAREARAFAGAFGGEISGGRRS